jgi:hypothetical protein
MEILLSLAAYAIDRRWRLGKSCGSVRWAPPRFRSRTNFRIEAMLERKEAGSETPSTTNGVEKWQKAFLLVRFPDAVNIGAS